ncbi:MAG TPA: tetratricopeptide repeat protein [Candidatus Binatia bacterium]
MRTASRRITRKDIRQPDWFVTMARELVSFGKTNRTALAAALVVLILFVAALLGWNLYKGRQDRLAAEEFGRAVELYHAANYKQAMEALNRLEAYRTSYYSRLGLLYAANTQAALQDTARSIETLRQLLQREKKDPLLRQAAYVSMGYSQEQTGQCKEAAASFAEAEKLAGPLKADATLGKARCDGVAGNYKDALAAYRKFLADNPDSERFSEVSVRIQELEAKAGGAAPPR